MILTKEKREELIDWIKRHIEHLKQDTRSTYSKNGIISLEIALASITASPEMYANCIEVCDSYGPEIERRVYPDLLSAMKSKEDHGGVVLDLFTAPPVPEIKLPNKCTSDPSMDGMDLTYQDGFNSAIREIKRLNNIED